MVRYIAIAWNSRDERDSRVAAGIRTRLENQSATWHRALDRPGLLVMCRVPGHKPDRVVIPLGRDGVVLGTLFRRHPLGAGAPVCELEACEIDKVERTRGRSLLDTHWGSYVLMLRGPSGDEVCIFRGPLAALPCYAARYENVHLFFSMVDDCVALNLLRFSINWPRIRAQVATADYLNGETGLNEVRALEAGACLCVHGSEDRMHAYWTPALIGCRRERDDFLDAASKLRRTVLACIRSWAATHESLVVLLSGGLDSSIVLAALSQAPTRPRLACVNFHSALFGDERDFARSMAHRAGIELIERERDSQINLRLILDCNRTVSPVLHVTGFDTEPAAVALAMKRGATAIFNGELGDELFGSSVRQEVLTEYVQLYGLRPALVRVALDYGLRRRISVWRALHLAVRYGVLERKPAPWSTDRYLRDVLRASRDWKLASAEAVEASAAIADRFVHPWSREAATVPAGKRQLVYALQVVSSSSYESPFAAWDDPPAIAPLVSQPLVELALAVPTHLHIRGGQNRALARAAFCDDLSEPVLNRGGGKGNPGLWLRTLIERNRSFLRELLLDGVLARERLIDRTKVERALSTKVERSAPALSDVIAQAYIEAWLRQWTEVCARANT